jgi:pimeloyl-ACP methyl ester carboxylesterase
MMLGSQPPEGTLERLLGVFNMISPEVLVSRLDEMRKLSLDQKVINLPAMYIQATQDRLLPDNALDDLTALLPHLETHRIEGPHLVLDAKPTTCARLVAGFLTSLV